jgi:Zn/Cd-binding protein ZinT
VYSGTTLSFLLHPIQKLDKHTSPTQIKKQSCLNEYQKTLYKLTILHKKANAEQVNFMHNYVTSNFEINFGGKKLLILNSGKCGTFYHHIWTFLSETNQ